ncbi:DUF6928 family protein [Microbacterium gorillae]|uniref:DUF6928 family protein n=1 Tax=Microbacterium gorillae TaxID=1231063 RepID=UPI003D96CFE8
MGLNFSFLVYSVDGAVDLTRPLPPSESDAVIRQLFPRTPYRRTTRRRLLDFAFPERTLPVIGAFEDGLLVITRDAHLYDPDILHQRYLRFEEWPDVRLLTSRSINDMFAYGHWHEGRMLRCLSLNAQAQVWRDQGKREAWETDVAVDPLRWLDLANRALYSALRLSGDAAPFFGDVVDWEDVPVYEYSQHVRLRE